MTERRVGAYVLTGDITWLDKTLAQYYPYLDVLVVPVPDDRLGWTGVELPIDEVLEVIDQHDSRKIARHLSGTWTDRDAPMQADTGQRQDALDSLRGQVDWVIQLDNDEYLPDPDALFSAIDEAEDQGLDAIEWPMRVLFRRTTRHVFEAVTADGRVRYDYPGAIAVRPTVTLLDARRVEGRYLRAVVVGDDTSLQLTRQPDGREERWARLTPEQAILHNSWARSPRAIRHKIRSWGHASGWRGRLYYYLVWLPAPLTWRFIRDVHPFSRGLWPRIARRVATEVESS